jgi:hypothetical protein
MARNLIGRTIRTIAMAAACVAFGAAQVQANCGRDIPPETSPYAILAPVTVSSTLGSEGRAAYEGSLRCPPGAHQIATDFGMRCKPTLKRPNLRISVGSATIWRSISDQRGPFGLDRRNFVGASGHFMIGLAALRSRPDRRSSLNRLSP